MLRSKKWDKVVKTQFREYCFSFKGRYDWPESALGAIAEIADEILEQNRLWSISRRQQIAEKAICCVPDAKRVLVKPEHENWDRVIIKIEV